MKSTGRRRNRILLAVFAIVAAAWHVPSLRGDEGNTGPTPREVLAAQIVLDMRVATLTSPWSDRRWEWACEKAHECERDTDLAGRDKGCDHSGWKCHHSALTPLVLVRISDELLETAIGAWAADGPKKTLEQIASSRTALRKKFVRENHQAFLLVVRPIVASHYIDEWGISFLPVRSSVSLVALDGKASAAELSEKALDHPMTGLDGDTSCFFFLDRSAVNAGDPCYTVTISGIRHRILLSSGSKQTWHQAKVAAEVSFRIETGEIKLLTLLASNVPWKTIESNYIEPQKRLLEAAARHPSGGSAVGSVLRDLAIDVVSGLLVASIMG